MNKWMKDDIKAELRRLPDESYRELRDAWLRTVPPGEAWTGRLLVPFIGSGLNNLARGGVASWDDLVSRVSKSVRLSSAEKRAMKVAGFSKPQQLERCLAKAKGNQRKRVTQTFVRAFSRPEEPSEFHKCLANKFPCLVTTNYNNILEAAKGEDSGHDSGVDLTNPRVAPGLAFRRRGAVIHLHGRWEPGGKTAAENKIFWGIGRAKVRERSCLVLTEHQYHRLYARRPHFQRAIHRLFSDEHLLLFMGSGLSADEFGIHHFLRDLQLTGGQRLVGVYVNFDVNPATRALLENRGLAVIGLPGGFGWKRTTREAVWHAFLDACSEDFKLRRGKIALRGRDPAVKPRVRAPRVVCVGLSSRQVLLGSEKPGIEKSHWVKKERFAEEPGGQHLIPALELVRRGRRVALVTAVGDDDDGDWILKEAKTLVEGLKDAGDNDDSDLDTQLVLRAGRTRRTFGFTWARNGPRVKGLKQGTRVLYDFEGRDRGAEWLDARPDGWRDIRNKLKRFKGARALYVGPYGGRVRDVVLETLSHVPLKFAETGTAGGADRNTTRAVWSKCTHVLSSAQFVWNLARGRELDNGDYQAALYKELEKARKVERMPRKMKLASQAIWPRGSGCLVVTLGAYGSAYLADGRFELVRIQRNGPVNDQCAWAGCGDVFRAAFIHAVLDRPRDLRAACGAGNSAAVERTQRFALFSDSNN